MFILYGAEYGRERSGTSHIKRISSGLTSSNEISSANLKCVIGTSLDDINQ